MVFACCIFEIEILPLTLVNQQVQRRLMTNFTIYFSKIYHVRFPEVLLKWIFVNNNSKRKKLTYIRKDLIHFTYSSVNYTARTAAVLFSVEWSNDGARLGAELVIVDYHRLVVETDVAVFTYLNVCISICTIVLNLITNFNQHV